MTTIRPFPIVDLAGDIIKHIDIPFEVDAEIPGEDGILMTEEGAAAVREARIALLKNTFWLVEYKPPSYPLRPINGKILGEARMSVVEIFALPEAFGRGSGRPQSEDFPLGMGFFAPGQDAIWPLDHAKWIRQVHPTPHRKENTMHTN